MKKVYFDNAATTSLNGEVLSEMLPYLTDVYGNSSSLHSFGRDAMAGVDHARDQIANAIHAKSTEIYFTSGGTEANNWAIRGLAYANRSKGNHIIVSSIEHHSIIEACKQLEKEGFEVSYLPVDETGLVSVVNLLHELKPTTILVSVMMVNNEIGTIQHIKAIGDILKDTDTVFHCDAVQAMSVCEVNVEDMYIDALSMSSHKIHGPKGVGALYVKKGTQIQKLMFGGEQEFNKRGGTTNVSGIVGFGKAMELNIKNLATTNKKLKELSNYFIKKVEYEISDIKINGNLRQKAPGIVNISFNFVDGESLLMMLDLDGVAVSTGSACSAGSIEKSHVLRAMGLDMKDVSSAVRFSFGVDNTKEEIDYAVEVLAKSVEKLRNITALTKKRKVVKK